MGPIQRPEEAYKRCKPRSHLGKSLFILSAYLKSEQGWLKNISGHPKRNSVGLPTEEAAAQCILSENHNYLRPRKALVVLTLISNIFSCGSKNRARSKAFPKGILGTLDWS